MNLVRHHNLIILRQIKRFMIIESKRENKRELNHLINIKSYLKNKEITFYKY